MAREWHELTRMTKGAGLVIERVRVADTDVAIEGCFELPTLACLSAEDQVFVAAFVKSHGSIKQMEQLFGVSYPTIKNRLNRIGQALDFIQVSPPAPREEMLARLERGETTVDEVLRELEE